MRWGRSSVAAALFFFRFQPSQIRLGNQTQGADLVWYEMGHWPVGGDAALPRIQPSPRARTWLLVGIELYDPDKRCICCGLLE